MLSNRPYPFPLTLSLAHPLPYGLDTTPGDDDYGDGLRVAHRWFSFSCGADRQAGTVSSYRLGVGEFFCLKPFGPVRCLQRWVRILFAHVRIVWMALQKKNSLGQDPCAVVSILEAACLGVGEHYLLYAY